MTQGKPRGEKGEIAPARSSVRAVADRMAIVLFLGILGMPLAGVFFDIRFSPINEMRALSPVPQLYHLEDLENYPAQFESYWNDHFGFRGALIYGLRVARARLLRAAAFGHVLIGRASWLFFTLHTPGMDATTIRPFTASELDHWQQVLEHRREWLQKRGCRYVFVIAPDKQTIYPEMMARRFCPRRYTSRLDQLLNHLREKHSGVEVVDLRPVLLAAKTHERLYHITDSHWNECGAFLGYQHLTSVLSKWFPAVEPMPRSTFVEDEENWPDGDLARMIGLDEFKHEQCLHLIPLAPRRARAANEKVIAPSGIELDNPPFATECDRVTLPHAVMFHDSFISALQPFLSEHFRRIAYVRHDDFLPEVIERERPEIVIQEWVERKLASVTPNDFEK